MPAKIPAIRTDAGNVTAARSLGIDSGEWEGGARPGLAHRARVYVMETRAQCLTVARTPAFTIRR